MIGMWWKLCGFPVSHSSEICLQILRNSAQYVDENCQLSFILSRQSADWCDWVDIYLLVPMLHCQHFTSSCMRSLSEVMLHQKLWWNAAQGKFPLEYLKSVKGTKDLLSIYCSSKSHFKWTLSFSGLDIESSHCSIYICARSTLPKLQGNAIPSRHPTPWGVPLGAKPFQ